MKLPGWSLILAAGYVDFVPPPERVLDAGPIVYADIDPYGDPDLEHRYDTKAWTPRPPPTG